MNTQIQKAIDIIKKGGVVIFPTDTVYGIGCRLDDPEAIRRVFHIRKRPEEKAVLAVVDSIAMAESYVQPISQKIRTSLLDTYWPGKLTVILPCQQEKVPAVARANGTTLAVRQTNHPALLEIISAVGVPLIAPSANFAGASTPKTYQELDPQLVALVDYVLEGTCGGDTPSTIIDCSIDPWKIIRKGAVEVNI